jgi:hypothetical protein
MSNPLCNKIRRSLLTVGTGKRHAFANSRAVCQLPNGARAIWHINSKP